MAKFVTDYTHSSIEFEVKHMMVSKVKGNFSDFEMNVDADSIENIENANITAKIRVDSISTNNEQRDGHLKTNDFFNMEEYPEITFQSTNIRRDGDDIEVDGDLTIKDVTKPVTFDFEYNGSATMGEQTVHGFEGKIKVNREDFGMTYNAALETGGVLIGKDVKVKIELQLQEQA